MAHGHHHHHATAFQALHEQFARWQTTSTGRDVFLALCVIAAIFLAWLFFHRRSTAR